VDGQGGRGANLRHLTTARFDYVKGRLNAETPTNCRGSPFDYETSTLLLLANDHSRGRSSASSTRKPWKRPW